MIPATQSSLKIWRLGKEESIRIPSYRAAHPVRNTSTPEISTGPTLNVPAAGLIYVVGNVPWAPGFITATFTMICCLRTAIFVSKWAGVLRAAAYVARWCSCSTPSPPASISSTGTACWAKGRPRFCDRRHVGFGCSNGQAVLDLRVGFVIGLAVTAKLLAALSFLSVSVWFLWRFFAAKGDRARRFVDGLSRSEPSVCQPLVLSCGKWPPWVVWIFGQLKRVSRFFLQNVERSCLDVSVLAG